MTSIIVPIAITGYQLLVSIYGYFLRDDGC